MAKRQWDKAIFSRYKVVASPSQMAEFLDCPRKWWFRRIVRLPVIEKQEKFVFGNILHAVIQRWLLADETGRGPDGQPVEIYPEGWQQDDDGGKVNKREAQLIQMLVKAAIESGLLRRVPDRWVEREFELEIVPGVGYIGALDVSSSEGVEDHKSSKSRDWILSEQKLAADPKMLSYAEVWLRQEFQALEDASPDTAARLDHYNIVQNVKLRLNYMVKDPNDLYCKPVEVLVPVEDVANFWENTIIPAAKGMLALKQSNDPAAKWQSITGPQSPGICKKYGGCPFAGICSRTKTPERYREEIVRANTESQPKPETNPKTKKAPMSIFGKKKSAAAPAPAPAPEKAAPEKKEAAPAAAPESQPTPPWANPKCLPCKGTGINVAKGRPCRACDTVAERTGKPMSDSYTLEFDAEGGVSWEPNGELPDSVAKAEPQRMEVTDPPKIAKPKTTKVVKAETKPAPAQKESPEGFRLFINCMPVGSEYLELAQIVAQEGAELADASGAESFYLMDSFKRRDLLCSQIAVVVAEQLAGKDVVYIGGGQDTKAYLEALRPLATEVFLGVF